MLLRHGGGASSTGFYVASAGGVGYTLGRESEHLGHEAARERVEGIGDTVGRLPDQARAADVTPLRAAHRLAGARLASAVARTGGA